MTLTAHLPADGRGVAQGTGAKGQSAGEGRPRCAPPRLGAGIIGSILPRSDADDAREAREKLYHLWGPGSGPEAQLVDRLAEIRREIDRSQAFQDRYLEGRARRVLVESIGRHIAGAEEDGRELLADAGAGAEAEWADIRGRMEASASGCRWLLGRLAMLAGRLDAGTAWDEDDRRSFGRLMVPTGLSDEELGRAIEDPGDAGRARVRSAIARESGRLEELAVARESDHLREASEEAAASVCDMGAGFERFQRYMAGLRREESKTIDMLMRLQRDLARARAARASRAARPTEPTPTVRHEVAAPAPREAPRETAPLEPLSLMELFERYGIDTEGLGLPADHDVADEADRRRRRPDPAKLLKQARKS